MSKKTLLYPVLSLCGFLLLPAAGLAASALSISSPDRDGVSVLRGVGLKNVSGMEVTVSYDAGTLANPRVEMGSLVRGMVAAVNSSNPVKLAVLSGNKSVSGDGTIATITFDRTGASPGRITSLKGDLRDLKGHKIAAQSHVVDAAFAAETPPGEEPQSPWDPNADSNPPVQQDPSAPYVGGTVTLPQEEAPPAPDPVDAAPPPQQEYPQPVPEYNPENGQDTPPAPDSATPEQPPPAAAPPAPGPMQAPSSVLESFRLHQGEKSVPTFLSFFDQKPGAPFTQYPAVGIADGKETVSLVIWKVPSNSTPKFLFDSARFVSLAKGEGGEWEVEVRPDKGAVKASVKALLNDQWQEMPLTVAPKVELPASAPSGVTEADFVKFLNDRGTEEAPKHDLNADGKRDYLDDYIYTANYLVNLKKKQEGAPR